MSELNTSQYTPWNKWYAPWVVLVVPLIITADGVVLFMTAKAPYLLVWIAVPGCILVALVQFALVRTLINIKDESNCKAENLTKKLHDSEVWNTTILMTAIDGFWLTDMQGRLLKVNEAYSQMSGHSMLELLTKSVSDFEVVEADDDITAHISKIMIHGHDRFHTKHRRKDGSIYDVEISVQHQPIAEGRLVIFLRDITSRNRSEAALRESEIKYRTLLENIPQKIFVKDVAHNYVSVNEHYAIDLGIRPEDVVGKSDYDFFPKELADKYRADDLRVMQMNSTDHFEEAYISGGTKYFIHTVKAPVKNELREVIGVLGIFMDITQRKQMEYELLTARSDLENKVLERTKELDEANAALMAEIQERTKIQTVLSESEMRYRILFLRSCIGILVLSLSRKITEVNELFARMHGFSIPEMLSMRLKDFVTPETHQLAYEVSGRIMAGEIVTAEVEHYHKDGHVFTLEVTVSLISSGGGDSVLCLYRDITGHKQAELDRIARKAAEAANRTKSIFVANMSHEIRTPMNAILGFAQVLACDPLLTPEQGEHVRIISHNGDHLLRLINDILDISKIEAGQLTINDTTFCLNDYLDELELMFRSSVIAKQLQLFMERDANVPRYVTADGGKLRQILINLVGNAIKFTETGRITVRVEAVEDKAVEDKDVLHLVVEVQDTGPGISDDDLGRIFDLFQQGEFGAKVGGAGLGLAISRRLAEAMGGELTVISQVGKGSCFRFDVPLKPAAKIAGQHKLEHCRVVGLEPGTGPFRILVVDDVPVNIALTYSLLRPVGFEVAEAANGVEALDVFKQWSPHAVLMDMRMPVMDGYEATRRIKSTEAGRATSVIALTSSVFEDSKKKIMATGVDGYISKPLRKAELFEVLGKCLGLRYVFADEPDKIHGHPEPTYMTPEAMVALPKELIHAMLQAVEEGEIDHLIGLVVEVEKLDSAAARVLKSLVGRFDYEKLSQWLKKRAHANE